MTENVSAFLALLKAADYKTRRRYEAFDPCREYETDFSCAADARRFLAVLDAETPNILPHDVFGFNRTLTTEPPYRGPDVPNNVVPWYEYALTRGFDGILTDLRAHDNEFTRAAETEIRALYAFCEQMREHAEKEGCLPLARALLTLPQKPPVTFYEACLMMKIVIFALRYNRNNHMTLGRFDQYMFPFFRHDRKAGKTEEELFETLELFFISLNLDTDLYFGIQQGDNGQSLVLGGYDLDGTDRFNDLSRLILRASTELKIIDPKINLRVNASTPLERYELATELTKCGLGFPQYCNDDIVVPGMIKLGYAPEDAADYAVAACWEFIPSGNAHDVVNIDNINLPYRLDLAVFDSLLSCRTFDEFKQAVFASVKKGYDELVYIHGNHSFAHAPFLSLFVRDCVGRGKDVADNGAVYNNYGILSSGISTTVDSLAAVKRVVFDERLCTAQELIEALKNDFVGCDTLRHTLLNCPKMGNDDDYVDSLAVELLSFMASCINGRENNRGGTWRGSTGSAQGYIVQSRNTPATPDGRKANTPYASSFTPSPGARINGPLSILRSFTKFDLTNLINGGPLTLELHDTVFRNADGIRKTAALVKAFISLGGHQLQLNSVNREQLLDAQKHPEDHKNLVVRVWGWSGYFNELDLEYQNHVIARTEYQI